MARCSHVPTRREAKPPLIDLDDSDDVLNTSDSEREVDYILDLVLDEDDSDHHAEESGEESDGESGSDSDLNMPADESVMIPEISVRCLHEDDEDVLIENVHYANIITEENEELEEVQYANIITEENEVLEEHPHLMPLIVKTEGAYSCSSNASTTERPTTCLPARHNWNGDHNFGIKISYDASGRKSDYAAYSGAENKLYVCKDFVFRVLCSARNVPPGSVIRATAVFSLAEHAFEIVQRCPIHIQQDIAKGDPLYEHVIQCISDQAIYEKNNLSGRYSVSVPYEEPRDGEEFSTYAYKLTCFSSCLGGINRRPFMILFTLENMGTHLGRQILDIKVCACPTRDMKLNAERHLKRNNLIHPEVNCEGETAFTYPSSHQTTAESQPPSTYTLTVDDPKLYKFLLEMKTLYESSAYIKQFKEKAVLHLLT